ncbi:hypothetical protein AX16_007497, partial [Volvariella volvacea WC 439]
DSKDGSQQPHHRGQDLDAHFFPYLTGATFYAPIINNVGPFNYQAANTGGGKRGPEDTVNERPAKRVRVPHTEMGQPAQDLLVDYTSSSAFHMGQDGDPGSFCHGDTRAAIIEDIISWIQDPQRSKDILWLQGPPGTGKTTIAKTIGKMLADDETSSGEGLAGEFFFFKGDRSRNTSKSLAITVAYRLAIAYPEIGKEISKTLSQDPAILKSDWKTQWRKLVVQPVRRSCAASGVFILPSVIIIDGLDECGEAQDQLDILQEIHTTCKSNPRFPIAFLIASRPEFHIQSAFISSPAPSLSAYVREGIVLSDTYETREEIRILLLHKFASIRIKHFDIFDPHELSQPDPWPTSAVIKRIVEDSCSQFIYPVTLLKYIDSADGADNPKLKLDYALKGHDGMADSMKPIYALYRAILDRAFQRTGDPKLVRRILTAVVVQEALEDRTFSFDDLAKCCGVSDTELRIALRTLHSILDVSSTVRVRHKSFVDFVTSPNSGPYYVEGATFTWGLAADVLNTLVSTLTEFGSLQDTVDIGKEEAELLQTQILDEMIKRFSCVFISRAEGLKCLSDYYP